MNTPLHRTLPDPVDMTAALRQALPRFRHIEWVESTGSTNADLLAKARGRSGQNAVDIAPQMTRPWLLGAHLQEHGRGRAGRTWQNRAGANLMFSCAYDVFLPTRQLPSLSPLAGVAACEALRQLVLPSHQEHITMKWPNDVQWKHAKLAGILIDASRASTAPQSPDHHVVIVGMGLNLDDARSLSRSLNRQVADWSEVGRIDEQAAGVGAQMLTAQIAMAWYDALNGVTRDGFEAFPARYARVDALAGLQVNIIDNGRITHAGVAGGVNTLGQLLVRSPDGETPISAGDVSVRPSG